MAAAVRPRSTWADGSGGLRGRCHTPGVRSGHGLRVPRSLSPSKVSSFTDCALAFRFSAIDRLPEPPSVAATKGTLVHAALERLYCLAPAERTPEAALGLPRRGRGSRCATTPSTPASASTTRTRPPSWPRRPTWSRNYFRLEDPTAVRPSGSSCRSRPRSTASACGASSTGSSSTTTASWWSPTTRPARAPSEHTSASAWPACTSTRCCASSCSGGGPAGPAALPGGRRSPSPPSPPTSRPGAPAARWRGVAGGRAGLRARGLPAPAVAAVRLLRLPGLLPGLRRRPRRGPALAEQLAAGARPTRADAASRHRSPARTGVTPPAPVGSRAHVRPAPPRRRRPSPRFDTAIDTRVDRLRGHPQLDRLMYAASELGDFSLIWHLQHHPGLGPDRRLIARRAGGGRARASSRLSSTGRSRACSGATGPPWEQERPRKPAPAPHHQLPVGPRLGRVHRRRPAVAGRPAVAALLRHRPPWWPPAGCT